MTKRQRERNARLIHGFFTEVGIISQLSTTRFERVLPHGMTMAQFGALNHLARVDDVHTPARLAAAFQVTKGAMTNTLQKLEAGGMVTTKPDPSDGRRKLVSLTRRGRSQRAKALASFTPALFEAVNDEVLEDIVTALPLLGRIRENLDRARNEQDFGKLK